MRALTSLLGVALGLVARAWLATLRVRVVVDPALAKLDSRPWVLAFFHGTQWPLLAWRRRTRTVVLVSWSRDGAVQARALALQGFRVVRGSSSRGGARGLAALVRTMKREHADAAFAVDGPRGPYGVAKGGAVSAARAAGAVLVPMGSAIERGVVLHRAWDRFAIAWPFSRVTVRLGAPIDPREEADPRASLERAIAQANLEAAGVTRAVSIDGVITEPEHAKVSVYDRGFLYADGVFETMRAYGGRPFAIAEHLERLAKSAAALRIALPVTTAELAREVAATLAAAGEPEATVRLIVTRGAPGEPSLVPREESRGTRVILVEPLAPFARAVYADGLRAITLAWPRDESPGAIAKQLGYVTSFLALQEARTRGADDAIFIEGTQVREATTANVFVVRDDGVLATPLDGPGVLGGITRSHVIDLASSLGISCSMSAVAATEMARAREVFLTSSVREIAPVVAIDGKPVGAGAPGEVTRAVHRAYRARTGAAGPAPWE